MPKRSAKRRNTNPKPRRFKKSDGTIKKWNTIDDIPMDEEDQCKSTTIKQTQSASMLKLQKSMLRKIGFYLRQMMWEVGTAKTKRRSLL
jgi:hypothetical protein